MPIRASSLTLAPIASHPVTLCRAAPTLARLPSSSALGQACFSSSRRRHTSWPRDWSSDVCSSDLLFQYFVIAPLRGQVGRLAPLGDAIKSDTLSVLSFEVGLFGWMALAQYVIWKAPIDSSIHWFLMQIGMMLVFVTSWPVNRWLLRHGIKEPMPTV